MKKAVFFLRSHLHLPSFFVVVLLLTAQPLSQEQFTLQKTQKVWSSTQVHPKSMKLSASSLHLVMQRILRR